jgi:hypothetical protein
MSRTEALVLLRRHDPARSLQALPATDRDVLRERIVAGRLTGATRRARPPRRMLSVAVAVLGIAALGTAGAWAAGTLSPVDLFHTNPQADNGSADTLFKQTALSDSTTRAATIDLPRVGTVEFWYAATAQKGWCGALRLPGGAWVGTQEDPLDAGGTVPGCYPMRGEVNQQAGPVLVLNGFDYQEGDIDARRRGGSFWRVRYGQVTAPGAVRVTDLASGRSTPVVRGSLFALAIPDPDPNGLTPLHLVARDAAGTVVADDHGTSDEAPTR